jgi:hypothetical protein
MDRMLGDTYIISELQLKMIELYPNDVEKVIKVVRSQPHTMKKQQQLIMTGE